MLDGTGDRGLWWERAGLVGEGPPAPRPSRSRLVVTVTAGLLGATLLGTTVFLVRGSHPSGDGAQRTVPAGLIALASGCSAVSEWAVAPDQDKAIVPVPGSPEGTRVAYRTVPPSFGRYLPTPAPPEPKAYRIGEQFPVVERLVHNMRRGYMVVFYDQAAPAAEVDQMAVWARTQDKVLLVPWENSRPRFAKGAMVGAATWGVTQTCLHLDPASFTEFRARYPASRAPESSLP